MRKVFHLISFNFSFFPQNFFLCLVWAMRENNWEFLRMNFNVDFKIRIESMMDPRKTMISTMICITRKNQKIFSLMSIFLIFSLAKFSHSSQFESFNSFSHNFATNFSPNSSRNFCLSPSFSLALYLTGRKLKFSLDFHIMPKLSQTLFFRGLFEAIPPSLWTNALFHCQILQVQLQNSYLFSLILSFVWEKLSKKLSRLKILFNTKFFNLLHN